jgi:hypothetical protein
MTGGSAQELAPIVIHLDARPHNVLDPVAFRTPHQEIVDVITHNIAQDGQVRRVIVRHARR